MSCAASESDALRASLVLARLIGCGLDAGDATRIDGSSEPAACCGGCSSGILEPRLPFAALEELTALVPDPVRVWADAPFFQPFTVGSRFEELASTVRPLGRRFGGISHTHRERETRKYSATEVRQRKRSPMHTG